MNKLGTILNLVQSDYDLVFSGVTTPYLYFCTWNTTFARYTEDMELNLMMKYSFSYETLWNSIR